MTEGPQTRSWAMEEQLAAINERQEFLLNKLETFSSSVHQHIELFDIVQQSLTAQQIVMTELMVNLTHLEWPPFSPPLLLSPSTLSIQPRSITYHPTMTLAPPTPHQSLPLNRLRKLEVPSFAGEDVLSWIFQIEQFLHSTVSLLIRKLKLPYSICQGKHYNGIISYFLLNSSLHGKNSPIRPSFVLVHPHSWIMKPNCLKSNNAPPSPHTYLSSNVCPLGWLTSSPQVCWFVSSPGYA